MTSHYRREADHTYQPYQPYQPTEHPLDTRRRLAVLLDRAASCGTYVSVRSTASGTISLWQGAAVRSVAASEMREGGQKAATASPARITATSSAPTIVAGTNVSVGAVGPSFSARAVVLPRH